MKKVIALGLLMVSSLAQAGIVSRGPHTTTVSVNGGGLVAADLQGRTLYVFDIDLGSPGSRCTATCAEVWPPYVLAAGQNAPSIVRPDGQRQLTINGRPVYTYAFDSQIGDVKGDGLDGVWHIIPSK